jgi:maltokinase
MTDRWHVASDRLAEFLRGRRWFGGKGREIRHAEVADVFPVRWPLSQRTFAVARVRVTTDEGDATYQLFLTPDETEVADALTDADFRRDLVDAFARGAAFDSVDGGAQWIVSSETGTPLVVPPHAKVMLVASEQTNSSVIIEGAAILKLYRKLEPGIHPDVEVTRFLTIDRAFPHVPVLLGSIRFEDDDGVTTAGMLQELVPGAVDAWSYALKRATEHVSARTDTAVIPFGEDARQLGVVTREMHDALASGDSGSDFAIRLASGEDVTVWCQAARRTIARALETLDTALRDRRLGAADERKARELVDRRAEFLQWPAHIAGCIAGDAGSTARTHGDYHLGQVLRSTGNRFLVIDFEGEPARPLAERRARQSPLRDVAGMLRSFAYAGATAGKDDSRAVEWEAAIREKFLTGYFGDTGAVSRLLPRTPDNVRYLLKLFEAEKVFYELHYELDHRPDWVWIPMHGISALGTVGTPGVHA